MFRLEMLPACEGDCLILSWGKEDKPRRILIDGGRESTAAEVLNYVRANQLGENSFELFIITHIDRDHIEGAVSLLGQPDFHKLVKEVWFNGRKDLEYAPPENDYERFGALDGERLTTLIGTSGLAWNKAFNGAPVALLDDDKLPVIELPDDLRLTIVSPDPAQLRALAEPWDETIAAAPEGWELMGEEEAPSVEVLAGSSFKGDTAKPNGSSIAFVAEHDGRAILLTGDAHVPRLLKSLRRYREDHPSARFAAVKAAHHGSRANTSLDLVRLLDCPLWLFSTNGAQFRHPDREAVARVLWGNRAPSELVFNYKTDFNWIWDASSNPQREFQCRFGDGSIIVDIPAARI